MGKKKFKWKRAKAEIYGLGIICTKKPREGKKQWGKNYLETKKVELVTGCLKNVSRGLRTKNVENKKRKKKIHTPEFDSSLSRITVA